MTLVLIESDWNLKQLHGLHFPLFPGINRIRLEFKDTCKQVAALFNQVLIESDWNLKRGQVYGKKAIEKVLIESDWNLKIYIRPFLPAKISY